MKRNPDMFGKIDKHTSIRILLVYFRELFTMRMLGALILLMMSFTFSYAVTVTSTAAGGTWTVGGTWIGGNPPAAGDAVIIATTGAGAVNIAATLTQTAAGSVTVNNGATLTTSGGTITFGALTINNGGTVTMLRPLIVLGTTNISGTINFGSTNATVRAMTFDSDVTLNSGAVWDETNGGTNGVLDTYTFGGSFTNNATTFTNLAGGNHTFSGAAMTISGTTESVMDFVTMSGTYTNNGTLTIATTLAGAGTFTNGATGILNFGGTPITPTLTATAVGNTINYTGTGQILKVTAYNNLTLSGGAETFGAITTVSGNLILSNTATATTGANLAVGGNLNIGTGTNLTTGANFTLAVTGTSSITGTLTLANTGAKTFTGDVTINSGGVWNETGVAAINYAGSLQNNGTTFTANTGVHTFSGTGKVISGTSTIAIPSLTISGTTTNSGTLTVSTTLAGASTLTNTATGILNFGGASITPTLIATAVGNTVNYNGAAQTVKTTTYDILALSGSAAKTFGAAITINGNLSISGTASASLSNGTSSTANSLTLGGYGQPSGTWGGNGSGATYKNSTYFAPVVTGIVTVGSSSCNTGLWIGGTSTNWNTGSNWCGGTVPTAATNVVILSGGSNQPSIGAAAFCNDITIGAGATLTITGSYTLTVSGNWTNNGGTLTPNTSTITFNGTTQAIGGTGATAFYNLTTSGSTSVTTGANLTINNLSIGDGTAFTATNYTLTVNGTTTIGSGTSGSLIIAATATALQFTGLVTVNAGGTWNNSGGDAVNLRGGIINNGTFTAGAGVYTFSTNAQALTGIFSIPSVTVTGITLTNNGTLTVGTALAGSGGLTNAATGTLNIGGTSGITAFTATAAGNTVNYTGAAQTCFVTTYSNLTLSGSGTKTFATTPTVNAVLSMEGTATVTVTAGVVTYGANATLQYNTATSRTSSAEEWITPFAATGGVIITNTGTITMDAAKVFNASIPLTINSGATLATGNFQLTFGGNFVNSSGTFTAGSSPIVIANTMVTQSIAGFTTTGLVSMTKTGGTATFQGNVNGAGLTINGAGGTLNLGAALTHTFTGNITLTAGTLNGGSSTLYENNVNANAWNGTGTVFSAGTGTVNFGAAGNQTLSATATTFNNLTLSNSGIKTFNASNTISGNLSISGTASASLSNGTNSPANSLTLGGYGQTNGTWGGTGSGATYKNSTYFAPVVTGIVNVSNPSCTPGTWLGGTTTDWNTASNWCGGVPTSATNVVIPAGGNQPVIGVAGGLCNNITINTGATLTITGSNTLTVSGDWSNSGTFTANTSTVTYNGTVQNLAGVTYNNLIISGGNTKTMQGNVTINGTLTLTNGNISLGSSNFNLTLANNATVIGSFDNAHMIICDGTGYFVKQNTTAAGFNMPYPVGTGTSYTPMNIAGLTTANGSISVRSVATHEPGANVSDLNRYWDVVATGITTTANVSFLYINPGDVGTGGNQATYSPYVYTTTWQVPAGASAPSANPLLASPASGALTGHWTALEPNQTLYSYQSGNWQNASTWTTDPSGTLYINPGSDIPSSSNRVVILNGRTVYTNLSDGGRTVISLTINEGGILDLKTSTGHNFGTVSGQGILELQTGSFPSGTFTSFVASGGGTVEYYNSGADIQLSQFTYNNLIINLDIASRVLYTLSNMTINGNLTITQGNFRISDNNAAAARADLKIDILGNVTVAANGSFTVGTKQTNTTYLPATFNNSNGNTAPFSTGNDYPEEGSEAGAWVPRYYDIYHKVRIAGDFTNNGTVRLVSTNVTYPNFHSLTQEAAATVIFTGATNNTLTCNGFTDMYNLILDKGTDQTYILTVNAARNDYFRFWGRNDMGGGGQTDVGNPELRKALWVKNGTLRLTGNTTIASLTEGGACSYQDGTPAGPNSDFYVPANGAMTIDGPNVLLLTTADSYQEINYAWGFNAPDNTVFNVDQDGCSSFSIRGKVTLNDGYMSTRESGGIIFWPGANGTLVINGGTLDAPQLRSADGTDALATFIMTGGNVQLRGQYANDVSGVNSLASLRTVPINFGARSGASLQGTRGTFNIAQASNVFEMSGGTITIYDVCNNTDAFAIEINAATGNINVTGGTFNINNYTSTRYDVTSNGPLYNLNISRPAGTGTVGLYSGITILNDLNLSNASTLSTTGYSTITGLTTNNNNVTVGHNFSIGTGTTYTPGTNITTFNGSGSQTFDVEGTITGNLNDLTLAGTSSLTLNNANAATPIVANGNFTIGSGCTLIDNGRILQLNGSTGTTIYNAGTHFRPASGAGSIQLTGTTAQTITGDGNGIFNNLTFNKTGGSITMTSAMTITGELRLAGTAGASARLDIGLNSLRLTSTAEVYDALNGKTQTGFSNNRMVLTKGFMSDNGLSRDYSNTDTLVYPFGFLNGATYYYMPAFIQFSSAPTTYGTVTTRPVNSRHYLAQSPNSLACYWKTTSTGFSGIPSGSVWHQYNYNTAFIGGNENYYYSGVYRGGTAWTYINDQNKVDKGNHDFIYDTAYIADGDYTAGELATFGVIPVLYSSSTPTFWDLASSWSTSIGGAGGAGVPTATTLVYIGDATHNHTITVRANGATAGSLNIASGSTLDLQNYNGHNFAALPQKGVTGGGTLRIASSNYFPRGDFGDFIDVNGGTVEYYTLAAAPVNITIPLTSDVTGLALITYKNLKLSPSTGYNIILPNQDLTIYGDMTVSGTGLTVATDGVRTPAAGHTFIVDGNLNINSGLVQFYNNVAHTIGVMGNTTISAGGEFTVNTAAGTGHNLLLYGNITNNGIFIMNNTGQVQVTFKGTTNAVINGTSSGANYLFYNLIVNKGTNSTPVLSLQSNITTGSNNPFLTLTNGTFRIDNPALNVTISTTTAFTIPSTACLSVNQGTATVGSGDNGDVLLAGKIEVLGGILNIGTGTVNNNDIEYASSGLPQINVQGGALNVYGQIRRNVSSTSGALQYSQSNGTVTIYGLNPQNTRGRLEIVNTNSSFTMSGGSLIVTSAGSTTYDDLYIRPDVYSVMGGLIQVGNLSSATGQTFKISSIAPLWDVNVGQVAVNQNLSLQVLPMTIQHDLTINGNSQFLANDKNVTIGRNLTNNNNNAGTGTNVGGYQAGVNSTSTQTTTFNGTSQSIAGNGANLTNFANLVFAQSGTTTLSANTALRVNTNLTLSSGILDDGGNTITVLGNIENDATHTSGTTAGGISFSGTQQQTLSGSGSGVFGNVILNNALGVNMIDNTTINGQLNFAANCLLYIDDYLLTFGANATVIGSPGVLKMIMLNGVVSDQGVKKIFSSGDSPAFTFPIGVASKYTPVMYDFSANAASNAYIIVKPVNSLHKSILTTPTDYIPYYWSVTSSGLTTYTVNHQYYYVSSDVVGNENNFIAQRYDIPTNTWIPTGSVVTAGHYINITGTTSSLDGEYTAADALTPQPMLYSLTDGNWTNNTNVWSTDGTNLCGCSPNGNPVSISIGNTITLAANGANSYSVAVNGTLDCGLTTFHSLGLVTGPGRIRLTATADGMFVFPGGQFDGFMQNTNSTIEFTGSTDATLPLKPGNIYKPYNNVEFTGSGIKYMSAENMKVSKNLTIFSPATLRNTLYNMDIFILGNWTDQNASTGFYPGTGLVSFEGSTAQTFSVAATENFYDLRINNSAGLTMTTGTTGANVSDDLYLTSGNITTDNSHLLTLTNTSTAAVVGGSGTSFVNGPLCKSIISGQSFVFPVGSTTSGSRYGALTLLNTSPGSSPATWTATYFNSDPSPTYPRVYPTNLQSPLTSVSNNEYWVVGRPGGGGTANIQLRWDGNSYPGVTGSGIQNMLRVAEYESASTKWYERSSSSGVSGNASAGTITTSALVTNNDYVFTIGLSGVTATINTPPTTYTICAAGQTATIPVTLTGTAPWTLTYKTTGSSTNNFSQSGIASSSYNISLTGADVGGYSATPYTVQLVSVTDGTPSAGQVSSTTVSLTVNQTFTPDITGTFTVGTGEDRIYSTTDHSGSGATYAWAWVPAAPSGGTIVSPTSYTTHVNPVTSSAGTYTLQVTETVGSCSALDDQLITVVSTPSPSITPTTANVCQGSTVTYSTPVVGTHTYTWTVSGGTPITGTGSSIDVTWGSPGSGSVSVDEYNGTSHGYDSKSYNISATINTYVASAASSSICSGSGTNINLGSSQSGVTYQLRDATTHVNIGNTVAGTGVAISLPTGNLTTTTTFEVYAYNNGCSATMTGTPTVVVISLPAAPTASDQSLCAGSTVANLVSTPPGGCVTDWYAAATGGAVLASGTTLVNATTYYAESRNTTTSCVSSSRTAVVVTINALPTPTFTGGPTTVCANSTGNVYTTQAGMTNYLWTVTGGSITAGGGVNNNTATVTWNAAGTGHVTINYTDANGCTTASATDQAVTINPLPTPSVSGNNIACEGSNEVYSTAATGNTFNWSVTGGAIISGQGTNSVTVTWNILPPGNASGTGTVNVTETTAAGCSVTTPDYSVSVFRIPQTGPDYHIDNTHNQ